MSEGVQRYTRTKMVLPLRVWSDARADESSALQLAHTIDISPIGGRLGGLRNQLHPGETIMLQRGQQRIPFRVVWSKQLAPTESQAGIEVLESGKKIWGVDLPDSVVKRDSGPGFLLSENLPEDTGAFPSPASRPVSVRG